MPRLCGGGGTREQRPLFAGMDLVLAAQEGMMAG